MGGTRAGVACAVTVSGVVMGRNAWSMAAAVVLLAGCATSTAQGPVTMTSSSPSGSTAASPSPASSPDVSASTSTEPSPAPSAAAASVTITVSGDLLWHNTVLSAAAEDHERTGAGKEFDFGPMFASVKPVIEGADLSICQSEVPFAKEGGPYRSYPVFAAPPEIADQMASLGFDYCTTTSNHALDQGFTGLKRTLDVWHDAGILTAGTFATRKDSLTPALFTTPEGITVAVVGGTYSLNGFVEPADAPWAVASLDPDEMLASAHRARQAGADIVLVQIHGGNEYSSEPNDQQWDLARKLTASDDVDLVYGQHVHVVQPWTKVNGKWVVFSVGNLIAQHLTNVPRGYEGVIGQFTFTAQADGTFKVDRAEYVPIYMTHYTPGSPARVLRVNDALDKGIGDRARLLVAEKRTRQTVLALGAKGLVEG